MPTAHDTTLRNNIVGAYNTAINSGSGAGILRILATATILCTLTFVDPAGAAPSGGVLTIDAMTQGTAGNSGTANAARVLNSTPTAQFDLTVGAGSGEVQMTNLVVAGGDILTSAGGTITAPT